MSIFDNKNNPDKWKNKYFELLDENEEVEKSQKNKEDLLCKTIIRLCLATTGFNKELDPYLLGIRNHLKKGLKSEQLKSELEKFTNALMVLDETKTEKPIADASLLFDFLFYHFPDQKNSLTSIKDKFENNSFSNTQYLFIAINDLIDSIQQIEPLAETVSATLQINEIDPESINTQLLHLLEGTEVPEQFESKAQNLKDQLINNEPLSNILDETIALLFNIKKHLQSEQQEMAIFLARLTEQLTELGVQASGVRSVSQDTAEKRNLLDQSVSSQILDLQNNSKSATKLEPLKQLINTRLADIQTQIKNHQTQEEIEKSNVQQELESLSQKINDMEHESNQLKNKLDVAVQQAIRDPLTDLPNRLAYDERISVEIARFKRYKTPLSILVWDIDLFKNINDNFGHKAGDKTLILIAKLLFQHCRESDFVSRFGGEEFIMLLSDTNAQSALQLADKLRLIIENSAFNSNGKKIAITISCGITQFTEDDSCETAFNRADNALYKAKNNGRNQCVIG